MEVDCQPIVSYESFARSLKVSDHLTKPSNVGLSKEGLFWLEFDIEYQGMWLEFDFKYQGVWLEFDIEYQGV